MALSDKKLNELADKHLVKLMKERPVEVMKYFLVETGRQVIDANAGFIDMSVECTLNGQRYKVNAHVVLDKI